jgi:hypothetical protein
MNTNTVPTEFLRLRSAECIDMTDLVHTNDGFWLVCRSLSDILVQKGIADFPDADGTRLDCDKFYDDWYLYAVSDENDYVYSLLKLREQEHDAEYGLRADGDTPGVTISFIAFSCRELLACLAVPTDENRQALDREIDRVVVRRGQRHHERLKKYFISPDAEGTYLVADQYVKCMTAFAKGNALDVPDHYREIANSHSERLPRFIESVNKAAGRVVCDHEKIYFQDAKNLSEYEQAVVLATHTGNTSKYSFAAEVEFHARFLTAWAKIKIPFCKKTIYESAVRADMTIGDAEHRSHAPYYRTRSKIVKRQCRLHKNF